VGSHDPRLRPVAATGQRPREGFARRPEEQLAGVADATADHDHARVQGRRQSGDADAEPVTHLGQPGDGFLVAALGGRGDLPSADRVGVAADRVEQPATELGA
jgi:hypothetical protein